jgi:hypothetical protein
VNTWKQENQANDGSKVSIKNIQRIIVEYRGRQDMDSDKLKKLVTRFEWQCAKIKSEV